MSHSRILDDDTLRCVGGLARFQCAKNMVPEGFEANSRTADHTFLMVVFAPITDFGPIWDYDMAMIWQTIDRTTSFLFYFALAFVLTGLFKRNRGVAKVRSTGEVEFVQRWWVLCSLLFLLVRFGIIGWDELKHGPREPLAFVTGALMYFAVIASILTIPGTIVMTQEAIEEVRWIWPNKKIRWNEIEEINTEKRGSAVTVKGSGHTRIICTNLYPDRPRFLYEIKQHCGTNLPPNFPNEDASSNGV
jgi:hypothetical protein